LDHEIQVKIKRFPEKDGGFIFILMSECMVSDSRPKVNVLICKMRTSPKSSIAKDRTGNVWTVFRDSQTFDTKPKLNFCNYEEEND